jgi:hypothetical protein
MQAGRGSREIPQSIAAEGGVTQACVQAEDRAQTGRALTGSSVKQVQSRCKNRPCADPAALGGGSGASGGASMPVIERVRIGGGAGARLAATAPAPTKPAGTGRGGEDREASVKLVRNGGVTV